MKAYYNQPKIASNLQYFLKKFSLSKPHLKLISFIITGMICAESVVTSDISRKLKDDFSLVYLSSIERRFRRFFNSFSFVAYSFFEAFIQHIISRFCVKHVGKYVHISFDHMFCKDKFTILLFSLRIGRQGIPIWFRCFKGKHNPHAYSLSLITQGISFCSNLFLDKGYHILFLADRWFPHTDILSHIHSSGVSIVFVLNLSLPFLTTTKRASLFPNIFVILILLLNILKFSLMSFLLENYLKLTLSFLLILIILILTFGI